MSIERIFTVFIRPALRKLGIDITRYQGSTLPRDFDELNRRIYNAVKDYTMTSPERVNALTEAVRYIIHENIAGALVECGVWKGGSVMAMALTLKEMGAVREIYLYDTFSGMPAPSEDDGERAKKFFNKYRVSKDSSRWLFSPLEEVQKNLAQTRYPAETFHFIQGRVEDTIPENIPEKISLLRLDTDFYASTKHALTYLFPLLSPKGIIILDDYGCWKGAKKAVDEYIQENKLCIYLHRIDDQGRMAIKMPD